MDFVVQALVARLLEGTSVSANNVIISGVLRDLTRVVSYVLFFLDCLITCLAWISYCI